jgi:UDP-N-acetylglucosamine transferase subunit ALG13
VIFVTVGSIHFDSLVREIDEAVARGSIAGKVVIQIGNGTYEPRHCEYFRTAPGLAPYYEKADVVIGHGGTGTTLEVLERGLRLISVSNPSMIDNHQHEFLEALEKRGLILYCRELAQLPDFIGKALRTPPPAPFDTSVFFRGVVEDIERL